MKDHYKLHDINIFIKDRLPEGINIDFVLKYISKRIPSYLLRGVDMIYIGQFKQLNDREVNALFEDGAIYMTNVQDDDKDMIDDIIHEIAHSIENLYGERIYDDGRISREFLAKRKRLYSDLDNYGYSPPKEVQYALDFSQDLDDYFYKEVGYDTMWNFINGLYPSPYAATSLREYFARGFEEYVMENKKQLKETCPALYSKIKELYEMED
tara:strand:+ start:5524 stop:6156 length:633 start_codon:yes stop_codon:yes gene_type:complete